MTRQVAPRRGLYTLYKKVYTTYNTTGSVPKRLRHSHFSVHTVGLCRHVKTRRNKQKTNVPKGKRSKTGKYRKSPRHAKQGGHIKVYQHKNCINSKSVPRYSLSCDSRLVACATDNMRNPQRSLLAGQATIAHVDGSITRAHSRSMTVSSLAQRRAALPRRTATVWPSLLCTGAPGAFATLRM